MQVAPPQREVLFTVDNSSPFFLHRSSYDDNLLLRGAVQSREKGLFSFQLHHFRSSQKTSAAVRVLHAGS